MTDGIKGFKAPPPASLSSDSKKRPEAAAQNSNDEPALRDEDLTDKVSTSAAESIEAGLREAAREVKRAEDAVRERPAPARAESQPPPADPASPPEGARLAAPSEAESSERSEPIRSPEEASRVADRVAERIRANPTEALAVNVNQAVVRALFQ